MIETYDKTISRGRRENDAPIIGRNSWDEYIRKGKWKLLIRYGRKKTLSDLERDPNEENNLVLKETRKAAELELLLTTFKQDIIEKHGIPERP